MNSEERWIPQQRWVGTLWGSGAVWGTGRQVATAPLAITEMDTAETPVCLVLGSNGRAEGHLPPHPHQNGEHQLCSESASDGQDSAGSGGDPRSECTPLHMSQAHQHPPLSPQVLTLCQALPYNFLYNLSLNLLKKFLDFSGVGHSQELTTLNWCSFRYKNLSSHRQNSQRKRDSSLT